MAVRRTRIDHASFLYLNHTGSYRKFASTLEQVLSHAREAGLTADYEAAAVLMSDPNVTPEDELTSRVGVLVMEAEPPGIEAPVQLETISGLEVYADEYTGELSGVPDFYHALTRAVMQAGHTVCGYPIEVYLKDPALAEQDDQCHIRVLLPVVF